MKKIYILFLLTAHVTSFSCMQQRESSFASFSHEASSTADKSEDSRKTSADKPYYAEASKGRQPKPQLFSNSTYLYSTSFPPTIIAEQPNYVIYTANQLGWEQLNRIADAPYTADPMQDPTKHLVPVYTQIIQATNSAPTKQAIAQKETKPLLSTITPIQPNNDLMQNLYNHTYNLIGGLVDGIILKKYRGKKLSNLIHAINKKRINGINEDIMGKFAYDSKSFFFPITQQYTTLFFNILKRYTLTVSQTQEALPFDVENSSSHKNLDDIFNLSTNTKNHDTSGTSDTSSFCQKYSAFNQILHTIESLNTYQHDVKDMYVTCLHANQNILFEDCSQGSYADLTNELFAKLYDMWVGDKIDATTLYDLLQIIESAKNKQKIQNESDLGYAFLNFEPTGLLYYLGVDLICIKKRIALFCKSVEQYNQKRCDKTTPTDKQHSVYKMHSDLGLALPDSFDNSVFDKNIYAFAEFEQLRKNTKKLMQADNNTVHQWVAKLYPNVLVK